MTEKHGTPDTADICQRLRTDGMLVLRGWLDAASLAALTSEVETLESSSPPWARKPTYEHRTVVHFSPLTARRHGGSAAIAEIARVFNATEFRAICDAYIGARWDFDRIILERNRPRPDAIQPWHVDHFPHDGRCLKFFVYLNDTDAAGGALCYVPGTHEIVHFLSGRFRSFVERQNDLHMYDQVSLAAHARVDELRGDGRMAEADRLAGLLDTIGEHIEGNGRSDDHYAIEAPAGSVIVFDPAGLHRGGVIARGERLIVRSHCIESKLARTVSSPNELLVGAHRNWQRVVGRVRGERAFV